MHFWAEVLVAPECWVTIEPSPGYSILDPPSTLAERAARGLASLWQWVHEHMKTLGFIVLFASGSLWFRRVLLDRLATFTWWLRSASGASRCVQATLFLVESRSKWAGHPRPPGQTPARWYGLMLEGMTFDSRADLQRPRPRGGLDAPRPWGWTWCFQWARAGRSSRLSSRHSRLDGRANPDLGHGPLRSEKAADHVTPDLIPMLETEHTLIEAIRSTLNAALRGKAEVNEYVLACLLARGHLLIEDLPGLGKTTLAKALAHAVGGKFARVQCTPDLLPGDITGFRIFDQRTREFDFLPGPVFADILLADEINRATPRTQSALSSPWRSSK